MMVKSRPDLFSCPEDKFSKKRPRRKETAITVKNDKMADDKMPCNLCVLMSATNLLTYPEGTIKKTIKAIQVMTSKYGNGMYHKVPSIIRCKEKLLKVDFRSGGLSIGEETQE